MTSLYQRTQEALVALVKRAQNDTLAPQERLGINHAREALSATLNAAERLLESEARDAISQKHSEVEYREAFAAIRESMPDVNRAHLDRLTGAESVREVVANAQGVLIKHADERRRHGISISPEAEVATVLLTLVNEQDRAAADRIRERGIMDEDMHAIVEKQIVRQEESGAHATVAVEVLKSLINGKGESIMESPKYDAFRHVFRTKHYEADDLRGRLQHC